MKIDMSDDGGLMAVMMRGVQRASGQTPPAAPPPPAPEEKKEPEAPRPLFDEGTKRMLELHERQESEANDMALKLAAIQFQLKMLGRSK